jgi:hypothetical protein
MGKIIKEGDRFHQNMRKGRLYQAIMWFVVLFLLHVVDGVIDVIVLYVALSEGYTALHPR